MQHKTETAGAECKQRQERERSPAGVQASVVGANDSAIQSMHAVCKTEVFDIM